MSGTGPSATCHRPAPTCHRPATDSVGGRTNSYCTLRHGRCVPRPGGAWPAIGGRRRSVPQRRTGPRSSRNGAQGTHCIDRVAGPSTASSPGRRGSGRAGSLDLLRPRGSPLGHAPWPLTLPRSGFLSSFCLIRGASPRTGDVLARPGRGLGAGRAHATASTSQPASQPAVRNGRERASPRARRQLRRTGTYGISGPWQWAVTGRAALGRHHGPSTLALCSPRRRPFSPWCSRSALSRSARARRSRCRRRPSTASSSGRIPERAQKGEGEGEGEGVGEGSRALSCASSTASARAPACPRTRRRIPP